MKHAALALDLLEDLPGLFGEFLRQAIEEPTAAGRVDHAVQMGFFLEHQQGIAGRTAAEIVGRTDERIKWHGGDRIGPAEAGRKDAHRVAQQIDVGIAFAEHAAAGAGIDAHGAGGGGTAGSLDDTEPQPAGRSQLANRQEVMRAQADVECDLAARRNRCRDLRRSWRADTRPPWPGQKRYLAHWWPRRCGTAWYRRRRRSRGDSSWRSRRRDRPGATSLFAAEYGSFPSRASTASGSALKCAAGLIGRNAAAAPQARSTWPPRVRRRRRPRAPREPGPVERRPAPRRNRQRSTPSGRRGRQARRRRPRRDQSRCGRRSRAAAAAK